MQQNDYLLREIQKLGILLRNILNRLTGKSENMGIKMSNQFEQTKDLLVKEMGFNLEEFLEIDKSGIENYLDKFKGINPENIELLADVFAEIGKNEESEMKRNVFFEKALKLYEICNTKEKSISFHREAKIKNLKINFNI